MSRPCSTVVLRVFERDASTLRDTVDATGLSWLDPLGEVGQATLSVPLVQAVMQADPTLLNDAIIKVATNLTGTSTLTNVVAYLSEGGTITRIGPAENADKVRELQCPGVLAIVRDWVVHPETGIHAHSADDRTFGWMSRASDRWYDEAQWTGSLRGLAWSDVPSGADRYRRPKHWPDHDAEWIDAGNNKEKQFFRTEVTVADDTLVKMFASADERLEVYLDSELIISSDAEEVGYLDLNKWRGILTAGTHVIGIKYIKELYHAWGPAWLGDALFDSYDRMIFTCVSIRPNGDILDVLRHSSSSANWLGIGLDDGVRPPAWCAGGIIGQLVREARVRGVQSADAMSFGYTDTEDTDSVTWPDLHERSWPVGTSGLKVLQDLSEHDIDFDMAPDLTLNAYVNQGSDLSATVAIVKGGTTFGSITPNILTYRSTHIPIIATGLLGRSKNRWLSRTDSAMEALHDRREGWLELGHSLSREQGRHHMDRALDDTARNRYAHVAEIIAVTGCVPYHDFNKGDTITAIDEWGAAAPMRVVSIAGTVPEGGGPVKFTIEFEEPE